MLPNIDPQLTEYCITAFARQDYVGAEEQRSRGEEGRVGEWESGGVGENDQ